MKKILYILLVSVIIFGCSNNSNTIENKKENIDTKEIIPERVSYDNDKLSHIVSFRTNDSILYYESKLYTGVVFKNYKTGQIKEDINYINGKQDGLYRGYYEDGVIKLLTTIKDGDYHGYFKYNYENGQVKQEGNMTYGRLEGLMKEYYENGQIMNTTTVSNSSSGINYYRNKCWDPYGNEIECEEE